MVATEAYDLLPVHVWTARPDGTLDYVNPAVTEYFCVAPDRILENGWQGLCHPQDLAIALKAWRHSLATGERYEVMFRLRRGIDQQYRWHLSRAVPVFLDDGTIEQWLGTNTEVDDVKRAEEIASANAARQQRKLSS